MEFCRSTLQRQKLSRCCYPLRFEKVHKLLDFALGEVLGTGEKFKEHFLVNRQTQNISCCTWGRRQKLVEAEIWGL